MCTWQSVEDAAHLIGRMLSCVDDGVYTITALARGGERGGQYASFTALFHGEETYGVGSEVACAEAASAALRAVDGGNLLLSCMDTSDGVPRVWAWRLLAGEAIPMSAGETREMHSRELGDTPVMPMGHVGCVDAYPIPDREGRG